MHNMKKVTNNVEASKNDNYAKMPESDADGNKKAHDASDYAPMENNANSMFLPPYYYFVWQKKENLQKVLSMVLLLPTGVLTDAKDSGDLKATVTDNGWHLHLKLKWPPILSNVDAISESLYSGFTDTKSEEKPSSVQPFSDEIYNMVVMRQTMTSYLSGMKEHMDDDVFSEAFIPLSMQVQKKIDSTQYMQCGTTGTRIVFFNLIACEQNTFLGSPTKKFRPLYKK